MAGTTGRESDKFMLRLPEGMRDRIKLFADRNSRSMNAEIVATLDKAYPAEDYKALAFALAEALQEMPEEESSALSDLIRKRIDKWIR